MQYGLTCDQVVKPYLTAWQAWAIIGITWAIAFSYIAHLAAVRALLATSDAGTKKVTCLHTGKWINDE